MRSNLKISLSNITTYAIYLYLIVIMINGSTGTLAVRMVRVIVFICLCTYFLKHFILLPKSYYIIWSMAFLGYNIIMCEFAYSKENAVSSTWTLFYVVVIDVLSCMFLIKNNLLEALLKVYIIGAILAGLLTFSTSGILVFLNSRSIDGMSANIIGFQCAIAMVCSLMFYQNSGEIRSRRTKYIVIAIICFFMTLLSASRKGLVYMAVPIVIMMVIKSRNPLIVVRNLLISFILIGAGFAALVKIPFLYKLIGNRVEALIAGFLGLKGADSSTITRLRLIEAGWNWFMQNRWFGYGMRGFSALNATIRKSAYYAHNNYIEILVDCGIIGAIIYYQMYFFLAVKLWVKRHESMLALTLFATLISFMIGEYGMVTYNGAGYQFLLLLMYIYVYHSDRKINEKI